MCPEPTIWSEIGYFMLAVGFDLFSIIASVVLWMTGSRWQKWGAAGSILLVLLANGFFFWSCMGTESPQGPLIFFMFKILIGFPLFLVQFLLLVHNDIERRRAKKKNPAPLNAAGS